MQKRYLLVITALLLLGVFHTLAHAAPDQSKDPNMVVWPRFWQWESPWRCDQYAGKEKNLCVKDICKTGKKCMKDQGCLVTSFAMLYNYYGLNFIPDKDNYPKINPACEGNLSITCSSPWYGYVRTNPRTLNEWMTDKSVYYTNEDGYTIPNVPAMLNQFALIFWNVNRYVKFNDSCKPVNNQNNCSQVLWSDPKAGKLLDYDLEHRRPDIMKIEWWGPNRSGVITHHPSHFVLIGGYDWETQSYRAYDPNQPYNQWAEYPPGLKELYSETANLDYKELRIDRFDADYKYYPGVPDQSGITIYIFSPVEVQVIGPDGQATGYDPATGERFADMDHASYTEESESSVADDAPEVEPIKVFFIDKPAAGNYIIKFFGTGDGPYTIKVQGTTGDGTVNLDTSFSGTASVGMSETYKVKYSPTGEATLTQNNELPIANAGNDQTGEQGYIVNLDGSGSSDPDGDPIKYSWSFVSKPEGSNAALSDPNAVNPIFTPDKPGTYTLQLVANDYITDSVPVTVTIAATPIKSRVSVTPILSNHMSVGSNTLSFDLNNIGRIGVSSGFISISLKDPDGITLYSGSQSFSMAVGESKTVSIPVTIPSLKFGTYTLTYTQSDETKTSSPTTINIPNSALVTFSFDKLTYRARETANLTLNLTETGKFDIDTVTVSLAVPDAGYTGTAMANIGQAQPLQYAIQIPATITPGQHYVNVTLTLPSDSSVIQSGRFVVQESSLVVGYSGQTTFNAGDTINLTVENTGSVDTSYSTEKLLLKSSMGEIIYEGSATGTVMAGENKTLADITIPAQTASGIVFLNVVLKDSKTGKSSFLSKSLNISGLETNLLAITDKEAYLKTEAVTAFTTLATVSFPIEEGELDVKVRRFSKPSGGEFSHFTPKTEWAAFYNPKGIAIAQDGSMYVADTGNHRIQKFDDNSNLIMKWGSPGSGDGQFNGPIGIVVAPDGFIYIVDTWNYRIQKFDSNGIFITKWGSYGSGDGQFREPQGIAVAPDGSVYVADTNNNRIQKFDSNGNFIAKWGSYGYGDGQFREPQGIAVDTDGSIYVAGGYIQKFDSNGNFIAKWGSYGQDIAVGDDGSVYVVDTYNYRIQKFDSNGNFITKWGSWGYGGGQFVQSMRIAVAPNGSVYVVDGAGHGRIQKFNSNGNFIVKWKNYYCITDTDGNKESDQPCKGEFYFPHDVAVGHDGFIYVADKGNHRVEKFDGDGNFITQWGSPGSGDGQFYYSPYGYMSLGIAVAIDGSLYVADRNNQRIQKFDSNGNFVAKWGSYGSGNGQFRWPTDVAAAPDGSVYVADSGNNRIQKFDSNGNFISNWLYLPYPRYITVGIDGSVYIASGNSIQKFDSNGRLITAWGGSGSGDGQFNNPGGIAIDPDNLIYVVDIWNNRIQKFDSNGKFVAKWGRGMYGDDDGKFYNPYGIAMSADGFVYLADTYNHRIQRMKIFSLGASETVFEATLPVNQPSSMSQEYITNVGNLNVTGKLYLQATLKNKMGQVLAVSEYPFYIADGNTVFLFKTDKKVYKPGETITFTGEVRNLADAEATNLKAEIKSRSSEGAAQTIYTETFNIPAGGAHPIEFMTVAENEGVVALSGTISQDSSILAEVTEQYEVARPQLSVSIASSDVVGKDPFDLNVEVKNTGKVEFTGRLLMMRDWWNTIDDQQITIPAGETKLVQYSQQIAQTTAYTVDVSGDISQTSEKTVIFGEAAAMAIGSQSTKQECTEIYIPVFDRSTGKVNMVKELVCKETSSPSLYPEGKVGIPVTIMNTGQIGETLTIAFSLQPSAITETRTYYLPKGESVTDTIYYDLSSGNYQLTAVSSQPYAFAQTSFTVLKENDVTMTNTIGSQGTDGLIPVTVNLMNNGYNEINGSINLAVMNNEGKAVWRGEAQVSGLKPQSSMSYPVNIDSAGIISGAYKTEIALYNTAGKQLAVNQAQVRVLGPIFEITSIPAYSTFTVGKQAAFSFSIKNTGTAAGTTNFSVKAMDALNQSVTDTLNHGEEKSHTFNFTVPEDAEEKDYDAEYILTPALSQGEKGQAKFRIAGVNIGAAATLDKTAYKNGDTALLTLTVSKQSQFDDGAYVAIIRYGAYHDMKTFTLTGQPATLTFSIPLAEITGENLFYSIHFESGRTIYTNSLFLNRAQPDLVVSSIVPGAGTMRTQKFEVVVTNVGDLPSEATTLKLYDGEPYLGGISIATLAVSALAKDESAAITYDWDILGKAGTRTIYAVVDPDNTVIERMEANNTSSADITIPNIAMEVSTTKPQYESNEDVGIAETVVNLTSGTTYTDAILTTTVKDPAGSVITTLTNNIPALAPGEASYANSWNTASNRPGNYTINSEVRGQGLEATTASTMFEVLPTVSAYGDMTSPGEVIQGFPLDIGYSITNNGNIDIPQAGIRVEVEDKARGGKMILAEVALDYLAVLSTNAAFIAVEKVDIEPGEYTIRLLLITGDSPLIIASRNITVKPPLKVTKSISMLPRVLVWTPLPHHSPLPAGEGMNEKIATDALTKLGAYYNVVHTEAEFIEGMRLGYFNTYAFLNTNKPTTDGLTSELVERVYGGDTLILAGNSNMDDIKVSEVTGTKFTGYMADAIRTTTAGLLLYEQPMNITTAGKIEKVAVTSDKAMIWGTVQDYPSIVANSYGNGKGVLITFDLGISAEAVADVFTYSALLGRVIWNTAPVEVKLIPEGVVPVEISIQSLGSAFDLKIAEKADSRLTLLDTTLNGVTDRINRTVTWDMRLNENQTIRPIYLASTPQFRSTYNTETEVYYLNKGEYRLYNSYPLNIELPEGTAELQGNILNALNILAVTKDQQGIKDSIVKSYLALISRSSRTRKDIDKDIHDLLKITEDIKKLSADATEVKAGLNKLLIVLQRRWVMAP